ncbi:branched-chain amino acid transport system II carrier protein [Winogradskyella alexanderae]|uniref:Branched-chain amino acid transport system II carrier protein n=1 Tax=Winogradskyella alexanderae TaxID=2877123 RepID=A0ABS7XMB5_9FLAO|nr:branched-chain amino acid transport system II carrier protein [Winogradskyella alexanderae]MCA0131150.1 branched-chain amino acid transport system II carrier protein [Winogradskyella alexanderae]
MNSTKRIFIFGFALFAGFFGAGNLILPPLLGYNSGPDWWLVAIGFIITATVIPFISLFGHAKLQGTMLEFGNKVSPLFSLIYCITMYLIIVALPAPRTAAVTHEIAIAPLLGSEPIWTSLVYFALVFIFVINRSQALNILGKFLTPVIVCMVLLIIVIGLVSPIGQMNAPIFDTPFVDGLLEGYQTYDALAGMVMGGVIIISLNKNENLSYTEKKKIIAKSGFIAMLGLFIIYAGLIALGAFYNSEFPNDITRTDLLLGLAVKTLGNMGATFVSVLVALACFTTAVAITVSIADFFKALFKNSHKVYVLTAIICCVVGVVVGSFEVGFIIDIALPALMFIYPISIVLILLNVLPEHFVGISIYRVVVVVTFIFSIPDFLQYFLPEETLKPITNFIPLADKNLGWVLPAIVALIISNVLTSSKKSLDS